LGVFHSDIRIIFWGKGLRAYFQIAIDCILCLFLVWPVLAEDTPAKKSTKTINLGKMPSEENSSRNPAGLMSSDTKESPAKALSNEEIDKPVDPLKGEAPGAESRRSPVSTESDENEGVGAPENGPKSPTTTGEKETGWNPNRRWIIKQKPPKIKKVPPEEKAKSIAWQSDEQKILCEGYEKQLREDFLKARFFSVQGDSCSTAKHAKAFLKSCERCRKECPEGILKAFGYRDEQIRNLELLYELGTKRCKGKETGSSE